MQLSHRKKIAITTVLMVVVIATMLGLAEGVVQFRQWLTQGHSGKISDLFEQQGDLRVLIPGASTRTISINSLGFRGPPLAQQKTAGGLRIAFIGGSTTFCAEVSGNDSTWPDLVTEAIQKDYPDIDVDYVNAAAPGYTVKSSLLNFRRRVALLKPDITIVYHATNDLSWETRILAEKAGIYNNHKNNRNSWLGEHSLLWSLVVKNLRIKEVQKNALLSTDQLEFLPKNLGLKFRNELTQLVIEAKKVSDIVALATFSIRVRPEQTDAQQLSAAGSALYYMPFMTPQSLMDAFGQYNQIIADVARETGAILIDGETVIPADDEHFNDSVHFKDAGSRIMAQRVREALRRNADFEQLVDSKRSMK